MTLLLRWLTGALGPWILGGTAAAFIALGAYAIAQRLEVANLAVKLSKANARNTELEGSLKHQNAAVDAFAGECKAEADQAVAKALRALNEPPPPAGAGPTHLNRWLQERARAR